MLGPMNAVEQFYQCVKGAKPLDSESELYSTR